MLLPWARQILRNIEKRSFHTSKRVSLFYESPDKDGYRLKSDDEKDWEKLSYKERVRLEFILLKDGVKQWFNETVTELKRGPRMIINEHDIDLVYRFKGDPKELNDWVISADSDHKIGFSSAQLGLTRNSKGVFYGFLDTKLPADGRIKKTGFCNLRLPPRLNNFKNNKPYDWFHYTHIVFRIRGDGRVYAVNLHMTKTDDITSYDTFHYFIWTRGGPYWQLVKIPFSKFFFAYKGRIQSGNIVTPQTEIDSISFTLADKITGPFQLEIDYIGVTYDPSHIEETAYEQYNFDQKFL